MTDAAWSAVAGGLVAVVASVSTAFFNYWLTNRRAEKLDRARMKLLKTMLEKGNSWRTIATLQRTVGADRDRTINLLLEIGARGSQKGNDVWGLISRNPLPEGDAKD